MVDIYNLSRAVASFKDKRQLDRAVQYARLVKDATIDQALIDSLWRDVQRTPKPYAI